MKTKADEQYVEFVSYHLKVAVLYPPFICSSVPCSSVRLFPSHLYVCSIFPIFQPDLLN
jgi:hypothetical protein